MSLRGLLVAAAVALAATYALVTLPDTPPPLGRGSAAPALELETLDGEHVSLAALRGRTVLVNFWATWCDPCKDEMPAMERLYQALRPQGFELLAVSVDDAREPVIEFRERLGLSFPILLDPDRDASELWQTYRYPESFLIAPGGEVVERYVGPREWDAEPYVARVRRLLEGDGN